MMLRRLDPLANSGPYQRILKTPVKSFTLTEAQFDQVREQRPELIVQEGESMLVGRPSRDFLEVHYGFPEVLDFREKFADMFGRMVAQSSKQEAPRGVLLSFRDRPNRNMADMVFWSSALEEGPEWVEMNWVAVPEQPEPGIAAGDFIVREASEKDRDLIAGVESDVSGQQRLSDAGLNSLYENARWLWVVQDKGGAPAGALSLRTEPGGWGIIDQTLIRPDALDAVREPLLRWAVAWLRNHGGRRIRKHVYMDDTADLALLRNTGFVPGETGLDYTRPVDAGEVAARIAERQAHGSVIKYGDWR
jgi:hypothetical protein